MTQRLDFRQSKTAVIGIAAVGGDIERNAEQVGIRPVDDAGIPRPLQTQPGFLQRLSGEIGRTQTARETLLELTISIDEPRAQRRPCGLGHGITPAPSEPQSAAFSCRGKTTTVVGWGRLAGGGSLMTSRASRPASTPPRPRP